MGDPGGGVSLTIFNVVVYTLVRHRISLVAGGIGRQYEWRREVL